METARSTTEEGAGTSQIQLESGELQAVDFPWLSKHGAELKAGTWQKEKLKLLPAAQSSAEKGFEMGLKNLRVLCLTLCRERLEAAAQEGAARMGQFSLVKLRRSKPVERWRGRRQSLASQVSSRYGYVPLI